MSTGTTGGDQSAPSGAQPGNEELYCLLVPLAEERLLVPRSCVTEVINHQPPAPMPGAPPWYLGTIAWGGRRVPLVAFEAACGRALPRTTGRSRIVVMQGITGRAGPHLAIVTQGFPQLVRLGPEVLHTEETRGFGERAPVIARVRMLAETPLVPDCERLEEMIAEETRA